ncbi:MAG: glucose-6-phosphate dehydrogenase [Xanthomonadales bacterium]|nr:glucose-6-phosphate dehydrogenase [Xanthomonadales bacterium]
MAGFVPVDPFDIVIFGGTGDLSRRKLLPALYHRDTDQQLPESSRIISVARSTMSDEENVQWVRQCLIDSLGDDCIEPEVWERFAHRLHYLTIDLTGDDGWAQLAEMVNQERDRIQVYYLATSPGFFGPVATRLGTLGVIHDNSRIVLEKPVGTDLESARAINREVGAVFSEQQTYRIDHYLGKETVQNLMALRFANSLFEPLWQRGAIDHVQITVSEKLGVGTRGDFYDRTGALRDMVQNHMLQLLCLVAMEAPTSLDQNEIRDEKIKVLRALRPISGDDVKRKTVRGQYKAGAVDGETVDAYRNEIGNGEPGKESGKDSGTETFVALKVEIDNWRWADTPFYLRTGKRLPTKCSEIVVQLRPVAHSIFAPDAGSLLPNRLVMRLQPNEGVTLSLMTKEPGPGGFKLRSLPLDLTFAEAFQLRYPDAYERLLVEVIRGNPALFMRRDEVEAAWAWTDQIIQGWETQQVKPEPYMAGTWGPTASAMLLDRDGRDWRDPVDD